MRALLRDSSRHRRCGGCTCKSDDRYCTSLRASRRRGKSFSASAQILDSVEARPVPVVHRAARRSIRTPSQALLFLAHGAGHRPAGLHLDLSVLLDDLYEPPRCRDRQRPSGTISRISPSSPTDSRYLNGWVLLFQYSAMCLVLQIGIGVFLAVALNGSRYEKILVTTLLMPMMMAPIVAGMVWYFLYNGTFGWYHWLLQSVGILGAEIHSRQPQHGDVSAIVIVDVWQWTPLITLITLAGLKRVPQDQLEANMVDGASPLPQLLLGDAAQSLSGAAHRHHAALHGQFPLHQLNTGADRRRSRQRHQDPARSISSRCRSSSSSSAAARRSR